MLQQDPQLILGALNHRVVELERRVSALEAGVERCHGVEEWRRQAQETASRLGIRFEYLDGGGGKGGWTQGPSAAGRARLARELRSQGWSYGKIATAMGCSERTVERYFGQI